MRNPKRHTPGTIATAVALLSTIAVFALYPVQAFGRIPPDHVDPAGTGADPSSAAIRVGSPIWTYVVVATVALTVGVALAHFAPRWRQHRLHRLPRTA